MTYQPARRRRPLALALLAIAVQAAPCLAQDDLRSMMDKLGFVEAPGKAFACEGMDLAGNEGRIRPDGLPTIVYVFLPTHASVRANLAGLEGLRSSRAKALSVLAITAADRGRAAEAARGLKLGFPIVARAHGLESFGLAPSQAWLLLDPELRVLGTKTGPLDWSSAATARLADALVAACAPGGAAGHAGAAFPAAPAPNAPEATSPNAPSGSGAPGAAAAASPATPAAAAPAVPAVPAVPYLSAVEVEVVAELSLARNSPKRYANYLREYRSLIRGNLYEKPGEIPIMLNEGAAAVDEAIAFLERQAALEPLAPSKGLSLAAQAHARDQGPRGATGHTGSDGSDPFRRMERYGEWQSTAGENCAYGPGLARDIVIQLIVDDGVSSRGHRANIFNPKFRVVGIGVGPHAVYGYVCVQDFAGGFKDK